MEDTLQDFTFNVQSVLMRYLIFLCLFPCCSNAQSLLTTPSTFGVLSYSKNVHPLSIASNQAGMARAEKFIAGVYGERPFMLEELSGYTAATVIPTSKGAFGGTLSFSGASPYTTYSVGLGYARKLGRTFVGLQFHYHGIRIDGYESSGYLSGDLSFQYKVSEPFIVGFQIGNAGSMNTGKSYEQQTVYRMGGGYQITEQCYIGVEMVSRGEQSSYLQTAISYNFLDHFHAWLGYVSGNGSAIGGAGIQKKSFRLDINVSYHPYLGISPGVGISKVL